MWPSTVTAANEVKPVTAGYRVVLTYNLFLCAEMATSGVEPDPGLVGSLARCLDEHFASSGSPDRLVYLLDHEYTRRGLDRSRLKGVDAERATLLAAAAERAGCDAVLALANVHEPGARISPKGGGTDGQRMANGTTGTTRQSMTSTEAGPTSTTCRS